ncbi:MAG TPA: hypothetical protein VFE85_02755 [Woeseiaceae bacterium]|nr:hypothetical protein [Woeseiaceae bacterium]
MSYLYWTTVLAMYLLIAVLLVSRQLFENYLARRAGSAAARPARRPGGGGGQGICGTR